VVVRVVAAMTGISIAAIAVRTTGVNWESVSAICAIVAVMLTFVIWIFNRRDVKQQAENQQIRNDITESVNHLSEVLLAKLETKETVSRISERLARLEGAANIASSGREQ
jgi:membrane protein implicated in regulation of membrane protease activity